jgi:hypothetical protein
MNWWQNTRYNSFSLISTKVKTLGRELDIDKVSVYNFLSGEEWFPTAEPVAQMGG